ncbi:MAG: hypothetical protein RMJ98_14670 [Myxococcales bacterium]|nr:hypothetical protein [Polyangiaceae bacterium]MDW8250536.1 hypothetical protein [Myxococcales bacterium]
MSSATPLATPIPVGAAIVSDSLRAALETRRSRGERYTLAEATAILVPLCVDLAQHHEAGQEFFLTPSVIRVEGGVPRLNLMLARGAPTLPRDRNCLAPEERQGKPGNARASVFSVGAILYEMVTGESVGPGMRRPTEIVPQLPEALEVVLSKALVSDPAHRPDDLRALAQALHNLAPEASAAVPSGNTDKLDGDDDFEVDVRLSMIPPAGPRVEIPKTAAVPVVDAYGVVAVQAQRTINRNDPTTRLADLKARLESDTRPRYVVIQDGMDHGPFNAVELLQQIASHTFTENSMLRDTFSQEERMIKDWEEFAPFAEQAKLQREIKAEKVELEKTITAEKKATTSKALLGGASLAVVTLIIGAIVLKTRGSRNDTVTVTGDTAVNVDVAGGVKASDKSKAGNAAGLGGRLPATGGFPMLPGGLSCEGAQAKYVEEMKMGEKGAPDLTQGQFASILNNGSYLLGCGVPDSTQVNICAAVQNGRAVGVTVTMQPPNPGAQACVANKVRSLSFPSNPRLDIARTTFK